MPTRIMNVATVLACFACGLLCDSVVAQNASTTGLATPIGKVISAVGSVTIEHASAVVVQASLPSDQVQAKVGDFVYQGDVVQTGADGKMAISFTDGTAFNISNNARMELNEFVYTPNGQSNSSVFKLVKGTFTFFSGQIAKTGNMKIDTAVANVGIRGTTPHVEVLEDGRVRFSTLIEEKENLSTPGSNINRPRGRTSPARTRRSSVTPTPLTPQQTTTYNKLFDIDTKLCRGC
jgi:hypothetical protein